MRLLELGQHLLHLSFSLCNALISPELADLDYPKYSEELGHVLWLTWLPFIIPCGNTPLLGSRLAFQP